MNKIKYYLFNINLIVLIVAFTIKIISSLNFIFKILFSKYQIYKNINASILDVDKSFNMLLRYTHGDAVDINNIFFDNGIKVFNQREILHMIDVREIFKILNYGLLISFLMILFFLLYFKIKKENFHYSFLFFSYQKILIFLFFIICLFGFYIIFDFNLFWDIFHKVLFTNDLYLLNPRESLLIRMLPLDLFKDLVILIVIIIISLLILIYKFYSFKKEKELYD